MLPVTLMSRMARQVAECTQGLVLVVAVSGGGARVAGQTVVDAPKPCQQAFIEIESGTFFHSAAARIATQCGARGGAVLAAALTAARNETDLNRLIVLTAGLGGFWDQSVFASAVGLATDGGASEEARMAALWVLGNYVPPRGGLPSLSSLRHVASDGNTPACVYSSVSHRGDEYGAPLQSNYVAAAVSIPTAASTEPF